jgi:NAD(P)-dependent dehydrogenase (short-subunit alcohol dehydrogenase family)
MDLQLRDRVALVTGVSRGIGLAVAEVLIAEGMRVFGISRTQPPARDGLEHLSVDLQDPAAGEQAVSACLDRYGQLDLLVNNAGNARLGTGFENESDETWTAFWDLNFMSVVRTSRAAHPHLVESGGVVVNISSLNGDLPDTSIYSYNATKAAMNNLTVVLSQEYARRGVRVVGVAPGPVSTDLWLGDYGVAAQASALGSGKTDEIIAEAQKSVPIGRFSTAEEIAAAVAFLASPRAGSITGTTLRIDGGISPNV